MKKFGKHQKIALSTEPRNQFKYETKIPSTQRSVDTNYLFKNDQLKELSKFAFNPSSRDVSHIRDKLSSSLPKLVPAFPTNFDHLKQLYYSSDHFGMPYSVSSSNLVSSLSCKKQSCVEKVLSTHNSTLQEDFTPQPIERLNLGNPTGRQDIKSLQTWLKEMKENNLETLQRDPMSWDLETIEKAEILYVVAGKELIRQVGVHCIERGEVLKEILWFFRTVFKAQKNQYIKDLREKVDKINKEIEEKIYKHARQIAQYEILTQKKSEKIAALKEENQNLSQILQKTQISLIKLQNSQEIKSGIFAHKTSPVQNTPENFKKSKNSLKVINELTEKSQKIESISEPDTKKSPEFIEKLPLPESKLLKTKETKTVVDGNEILMINEILYGNLPENEKNIQTDSTEKPVLDECVQTEKLVKKTKNKFEFRPRLPDPRHKPDLYIEEQEYLAIFPQIKLKSDHSGNSSPELISISPNLEKKCVIKAQKTLRTIELELEKLESLQKPLKRSSLLTVNQKNSKSKSRLSPAPDPESPNKVRKMSQQILSSNDPDDILINKIITKQKACNDLGDTIKEKKLELQNLKSEIEEKQQKLSKMKIELQMKYLEFKNSNSPLNAENKNLSQILADKLTKIKIEDVEGIVKDEVKIQDLSQVISQNFHVESWKAGFNTGFEKGVAVGFSQGEELGIEVGEDQGFIKTIHEFRGKNESRSESSSFDSENDEEGSVDESEGRVIEDTKKTALKGFPKKKRLDEESKKDYKIDKNVKDVNKNQREIDKNHKELDKNIKEIDKNHKENNKKLHNFEENKKKLEVNNKILPRSSFISPNSIQSFDKSEGQSSAAEENLKSSDNKKLLKRSTTTITQNKLNQAGLKSKDLTTDPTKSNERPKKERSSSIESDSKSAQNPIPNPNSSKPSQSDQKLPARPQMKNLTTEPSPVPDIQYTKKSRKKSENPEAPDSKILQRTDLKNHTETKKEKFLNKQQTFTDPTSKDFITIVINKEKPQLEVIQNEDSSVESNRLNLKPSRQRKNSKSLKAYNSDLEDLDKFANFTGEDASDAEGKRIRESNGVHRKRIREITKFNEFRFHTRLHQFIKRTNPATKIIEGFLQKDIEKIIKRSKMSKRMAFRILNGIYQSYYSKGKPGDTLLVEHVYDEFLQKYSVKSICSKKLKEFLGALLKTSSCKRSLMFLRLTGISEKLGIRGYSQTSLPLYMQALNFMLNSKLGIIIALDETADKIMIPIVRVTEFIKETFENKLEKNTINRLILKLEMSSTKDPKKINSAGLVENELALEQILDLYEEYQKSLPLSITDQYKSKEDIENFT